MILFSRQASRSFTRARVSRVNRLDALSAVPLASVTARAATSAEPTLQVGQHRARGRPATLRGESAACIPSLARTAARKRKYRSSHAATDPSTAQTASGTIVPIASRRIIAHRNIRPTYGQPVRYDTQPRERHRGWRPLRLHTRNLCFEKSLAA